MAEEEILRFLFKEKNFMENLMGMKELYDVVLKATYPIEVGKRIIEEG